MNSYEYKVDGKTVVLQADENLVAVRFKEPAPHSVRLEAVRRAGVEKFAERLEVPGEKFTIFDVRTEASVEVALENSAAVERVTPVFRHGNAQIIATERVLVGLGHGASAAELAAVVAGTVVEELDDECVIQLAVSADPLAAAQILAARKDVEYAEPDFINIVPKLARRSSVRGRPAPMDAFDKQQYAMSITRATDAWTLVRGRRDIRIAVLDEGVDTLHEDLKSIIVGSYDAHERDTFQEPNPWDGHGTACAGLVAAVHNKIGVRGVASGCTILAIRIAYSEKPGGDWKFTPRTARDAIDWAWKNGASVLSNSWGGGVPSNAISRAFERARTMGRVGKGCVVVIAAGNDNGAVDYPANLPNVLCVAASNEFDEPKTKTSHDGETWWGSNFGPEVDLAAPGVHNFTTDITGTGGYNRGPLDFNYLKDFNGTSSATPIVAGAAALVLSANPGLTEAEVRKILIDTAEKVGGVPYDNRGHHKRMGYGRVNVAAAVKQALALA